MNVSVVTVCAELGQSGVTGDARQTRFRRPGAPFNTTFRICESPAVRGFREGRRRPTRTEQGGSGIPSRAPTLNRQPDYVAIRRNLSIPAGNRQTNGTHPPGPQFVGFSIAPCLARRITCSMREPPRSTLRGRGAGAAGRVAGRTGVDIGALCTTGERSMRSRFSRS